MTWQKLRGERYGLDKLQRFGLERETSVVTDPGAVRERLRGLIDDGYRGWVCFTGQVWEASDDASLPDEVPLTAELCKGDASVQLRHLGERWQIVWLRCTSGDTHWCRVARYRAVAPGGEPGQERTARYEIFWEVEPEVDLSSGRPTRPLGPVAARFCGFDPEDA